MSNNIKKKKIITSACPICHGRFKEDFNDETHGKIISQRSTLTRMIGIKCPNCVDPERWLLGAIEYE